MPTPQPRPAPTPERCPARFGVPRPWKVATWAAHGLTAWLLVAVATGCSRQIEEEPPIPAHRYEPSETWCALMFDPVCPAQPVEVETEEECVEGTLVLDILWGPISEDEDACAATLIPYVDCLASLPCDELQRHFALINMVPPAERSSCGELMQAQLDCQTLHYFGE